MFYKLKKNEDGAITAFIYPEAKDFKNARFNYFSYTSNLMYRYLCKILDEILPPNEIVINRSEYYYAQAKFMYPLFHRKVETRTNLHHDPEGLKMAGIQALRQLSRLVLEDFSDEMRHMNAFDYDSYKNDEYANVLESAFSHGEIQLCLTKSKYSLANLSLLHLEFSKILCLKPEIPALLHSEEATRYTAREARIQKERQNYNDDDYKIVEYTDEEPLVIEFDAKK